MATLDDLTEEVLSHQFSPAQYDTYVRAQINRAEKVLAAEVDFRLLLARSTLSIQPGYIDYFLQSNFQRIYNAVLAVGDGENVGLTQCQWKDLDLLDGTATGRPQRYAVGAQGADNTIRIWPVPDAAYTVRVRYFREPGTMVSGSDSPVIPERWQDLLVSYALIRCYERENDYNSAQYHQGVFDRDLEKMKGQAQYDSDDYSQATQVGDSRTDPLAPNTPYWY